MTDVVARIRVLLVEDHPLICQGVRRVLEQASDIAVVGEATGGEQALVLLKDLQPEVMVCDIRMPGLSGIEIVRRSKEYSPRTRSIMLSAYDDDEYIRESLACGACGYLLKTIDVNEIPEAIRRVHSGQLLLHPQAADKLARLLSNTQPGRSGESLTPKECEIMSLAARGLSNKAIAKELGMSVRTVEGHFSRIYVKLSVSSRFMAVKAVQSRNLIS